MIFGMTTFTLAHVVLSLLGIASGFVVLGGLLSAKRLEGWTAFFLVTTIATSVTGFGFPFRQFLPSHGVGILSLIIAVFVLAGRYSKRLAGPWRATYAGGAVTLLYLNVFVLIVQLFLKVPTLRTLAPTQSDPPFVIAQALALAVFAFLGTAAVKKFHPGTRVAA